MRSAASRREWKLAFVAALAIEATLHLLDRIHIDPFGLVLNGLLTVLAGIVSLGFWAIPIYYIGAVFLLVALSGGEDVAPTAPWPVRRLAQAWSGLRSSAFCVFIYPVLELADKHDSSRRERALRRVRSAAPSVRTASAG